MLGALGNSRLQLTLNEDAERIFIAEVRGAAAYLWHALDALAESKTALLLAFAEGLRDEILGRRASDDAAAAAFGQSKWKATCRSKLRDRLTAQTNALMFDFGNGIVGSQLMKRLPQNVVNIQNSIFTDSPVSINQSLTFDEKRAEITRALQDIARSDEFRGLPENHKSKLSGLTDEALTQIAKSPPDASRINRKLKQLQGFAGNIGAVAASKAIADLIVKAASLFG
ncbi:hypothetical protein [Methylobacterium soli]|uniref:Uncharacterized protein n=1 Tax=Methylobacterium soli TaxID=553447 RepID=A0A6L3SXW4_9HYPH|nr:hypothetical protein [Methylobacterium soli]KAB1078821.1 hypothetical protein F6X53_12450 [Methylobacterium soli]GJE41605.1 hypothetical protein AEGHOMDF_0771 [Methylobacterium soli]